MCLRGIVTREINIFTRNTGIKKGKQTNVHDVNISVKYDSTVTAILKSVLFQTSHRYNLISSSLTADGVRMPRSVNNIVI